MHEQLVISTVPYINVVSEQMKVYVEKTFFSKGRIMIAPDGIPDDLSKYTQIQLNKFKGEIGLEECEKIILYAGSFKKIGGVTELVSVFLDNTTINKQAVLLLIGDGQEEKRVKLLIENSKCKNRIYHISSLPHEKLVSYMKIADVIVCPDLNHNKYNEITPHIKLFDAIASGRNVVATDFKVNTDLFNTDVFNIYYFSYDVKNSFRDTLLSALQKEPRPFNEHLLKDLTYSQRTKIYLETYY